MFFVLFRSDRLSPNSTSFVPSLLTMINASFILAFVVLLVLLVVTLWLFTKSTNKRPPIVLLAGPSGSGKTSLFLRWTDSEKPYETVLSLTSNEAPLEMKPEVALVDTPGNERLVQHVRLHLKDSNVRAVVFVLDAASGAEQISAAARPLMTVLEAAERRRFPVLIAANKYDQFNSLSVNKVRTLLEAELTELRNLKSRTVQSSETTDDSWEHEEFLGLDGKDFEFADLEADVEILDGSVTANRLGKWEAFLENVLN